MSLANKYNKPVNTSDLFSVNTEGFSFINRTDLEEGVDYVIVSMFINSKSPYGPQPIVAISDGNMVGLPADKLDDVKDMLRDQEVIDAINAGRFGFNVYKYDTKTRKGCTGINWVDIEI